MFQNFIYIQNIVESFITQIKSDSKYHELQKMFQNLNNINSCNRQEVIEPHNAFDNC